MTVLLEVDPNLVQPGWAPLVVVLLLGVVLFFLGRSMLKQFRKIDVPADHDPAASAAGTPGGAGATGAAAMRRGAGQRTVTDPGGKSHIPDLRSSRGDRSGDAAPPERS